VAIEIRRTFTVSAPVDAVWAFLIDPAQVVTCMPGAELEGAEDERTWLGNVQVKVGAVSARYRGRVRFERVDAAERAVRLSAEGREAGGGIARGTLESRLRPLPGGGTEVVAEAAIDLTGRIAQMGRGLIQGVSDQLFQQFAARTAERLEGASAAVAGSAGAAAPAVSREAEPLRLLPVVLRSAWSALVRWVQRLLGRSES
jgi:carbon monoxide dehydrogenase subunit G